ncbi:MAG: glycosyltransferase family 4 protein [Ilumatobacteraceae bacterium]
MTGSSGGDGAADVVVNMLWCVPGGVGGSEEYLVRQLLGLSVAAQHGARHWSMRVAAARGLAAAHADLASRMPMVEPPFASDSRVRRILGEATWLRRLAAGAALVHHGGGTAPSGPGSDAVPYVLTVHDLQFRTYPHYFSAVKRAYLGAVLPRSARRARVVAVPSEYVRRSVIEAYGIDERRVMVVPHGIDAAERAEVTPEAVLRARYSLGDGPVVVYPAVTHPHKNHAFVLELMRTHWRDPDLRLVLTGGRGASHAVVDLCDDPRVRHLGRVPAADRNGLVAMSRALVFPSEYEGFGAPLIEAMTLGAPVVCSDRTCMPDVVGDAGVVLPLSVDAWAGALDEVDRRRAPLVAAGHRRAEQFTSVESGRALSAVYERALS